MIIDVKKIQELISQKALFIINHSAGKDSQAMYLTLKNHYKIPAAQILLIHADLADSDWPGLQEHIKATTDGLPLHVAKAVYKDGSKKTLLGEWERKGKAPSSGQPWCKSDLKRDPSHKIVKRYMKEHGFALAVNCLGIRAQESAKRFKMNPWTVNKRLTLKTGKRTVWDWYPIFEMTEKEVFQTIADAGEKPHWAYAAGMSRLSCCFCIMANKSDLTVAAGLNPELYRRYVEIEKRTGFTLQDGKTLEETTGIKALASA